MVFPAAAERVFAKPSQFQEEVCKMKPRVMKADLHVHSKYSTRPSEWILRKIGCAESYTEPARLYAIAKARGMSFVTITDHNTIAGSLEIAHLEGAFVSEEITTYFPDDRCKLHVLAHRITEVQHLEISRLRENIFELIPFLNREDISHAVAHPLYSINERLTVDHVEKILLLFNTFEVNGSRDDHQNRALRTILSGITEEDLEFLEEKHGIPPYGITPWKKRLIGGSDDHSSLNIAYTWTEVDGAASVDEFLTGIGQNRCRAVGRASSPKTLARNLYSIAYRFYREKLTLDRFVSRELLYRFVNRALIPEREEEEGLVDRLKTTLATHMPHLSFHRSTPVPLTNLLQREAKGVIEGNDQVKRFLKRPAKAQVDGDEAWYGFVVGMSDKILRELADSIMSSLSGANLFHMFNTIGSAGSLYTMLAPYFVSYSVFTKDRRFSNQCLSRFSRDSCSVLPEALKIAHFTDTFYEVNGVAKTLQLHVKMALKNQKQQAIITCSPEPDTPGVVNFKPIGTYEMPEYPDLKLFYPSLLAMLQYCHEESFTHMHSATPGPSGLAALAIARILKRPICSTYHTALPQYVAQLTEDPAMEEIMWRYTLWYYNQMDVVYVPSHAIGDELEAKGIPAKKIRFYPRGIDSLTFNPSKRNGFFKSRYRLEDDLLKLLYVGRVSREKNITLLEDVFQELYRTGKDIHLIIVGEGPYLEEMKTRMRGLPVTFTGFLDGEDLCQAYASSDIFVFPSTTDTFGNVVLEAQASGLPVIVTDEGGPKENLIPGKTGFVVPADNTKGFAQAILGLMEDPLLLKDMKENARRYSEGRSFEKAYMDLWDSYRNLS
jgi:glycosyltransferase involved in cell wall biosynthesis